jgi:hypothetical protein
MFSVDSAIGRSWVWAGYRLQRIQDGDATFFIVSGPDSSIEFLTNFDFEEASEYRGIPTTVALPRASAEVAGLSYMQTGPEEHLLPFAIKKGVHFLSAQLRQITLKLGLRPVILPGEAIG